MTPTNSTRGPLEIAAYNSPTGIACDLGLGDPLQEAPQIGRDTRSRIVQEEAEGHHYSPKEGMEEVRTASRVFSAEVDKVQLEDREIVVSELGTAWFLRLIAESLLKKMGPFVALVALRFYSKHISALNIYGVKVVLVDYENEERPYGDILEEAIVKNNAKLVVDSSVRNPTTAILDEDSMKQGVYCTGKHGCIYFMDDAYRHVYRTRRGPIPSVLTMPGARDEMVVTSNSFAKCFRWPGLRGGLLFGNPDVVKMVQDEKNDINEGGDPASQLAMAAMLRHPEILQETRNGYDHAAPALVRILQNHGWTNAAESDASIFHDLDVPPKWAAKGLDSTQLCNAAANRGVVMYDDRKFGGKGKKVRVCIRGTETQWHSAGKIIGQLIDSPPDDFSLHLPA